MPWTTPTLKEVRTMVRDDVIGALRGAALIGNSPLRIMSDVKAGVAHLTLRYIDWLARMLLPDTSEVEWLDRHGDIWLKNADGSVGRKKAAAAFGTATITGINTSIITSGVQISGAGTMVYEVVDQETIGPSGTTVINVRALSGGLAGNLEFGETLTLAEVIPGIDNEVSVISIDGGTDQETDDQLRSRVLFRIQKPPMGGDADDYVLWCLANNGVTRAWSYPNEMGIGTCTVRFMMDDLRASSNGIPRADDLFVVSQYLDKVRPVAVKDFFTEAPIAYYYNLTISKLDPDNETVRGNIETSIKTMEKARTSPGCTLYRSWVDEAISTAAGENSHELTFDTIVMPSPGHIPVLGTITYAD